MINIGGNPLMILLAIAAALGGVGLYFVRNFRPELARDHDIFFSAIALVYGIILLAFNFRMEITTQLAQVLLVGFAGWFAVESLVLRQALSTQARRSPTNNNPIADDPIGSDYRVELDTTREISPRRDRNTRRMRGTGPNSSRPTELRGDIDDDEDRPARRSRRNSDPVIDIDDDDIKPVTPKSRRPRPKPESPESRSDRDRNEDVETPPSRRRRPPSNRQEPISDSEFSDWDDY